MSFSNNSSENSTGSSRKSTMLLATIAAMAVLFSVSYYLYSTHTAETIKANAIEDIQDSTIIQTSSLGKILTNKVESIKSNLVLLADAKGMLEQQNNTDNPASFAAVQGSTSDFTDSYFWLDKDGRLLWSSSFSSNQTTALQFVGTDQSGREYYAVPRDTKDFHITTTSSAAAVNPAGAEPPRIFFSAPIMSKDEPATFMGAMVASANLKDVGQYLKNQLTPSSQNTVGLIAMDGTILYDGANESNIGLNALGEEFRSSTILPERLRAPFTGIVSDSLSSGAPGYGNLGNETSSMTIAYQPVRRDSGDSNSSSSTFAILYVMAPHNLADSTTQLLRDHRIMTTVLMVSIGTASSVSAAAVIRWNKALSTIVAARTAELAKRTDQLEEKTRELGDSNRALGEACEQLKVHDRLQKEFVNVAAHELRTPIQPLLAASEIMESNFGGKETIEVTRPEIEMIVRNAKRLERLSSDILEIARIESKSMRLNKEMFSLSYIISNAIKDSKAQTIYNPDKLKLNYTPDDIFVYADREKITQVVSNLLTNAIKFTEGGSITVATEMDDRRGRAIVSVKDTGTGIDPEIQGKIFEKFVTKSDKGTGIGLYISKKIMEAHGGEILGRNNPDGLGATFTLSLPIASKGPSAGQEEEEEEENTSGHHQQQ